MQILNFQLAFTHLVPGYFKIPFKLKKNTFFPSLPINFAAQDGNNALLWQLNDKLHRITGVTASSFIANYCIITQKGNRIRFSFTKKGFLTCKLIWNSKRFQGKKNVEGRYPINYLTVQCKQ